MIGLSGVASGPMLRVRIAAVPERSAAPEHPAATERSAGCGFCPVPGEGQPATVRTPLELVTAAAGARGGGLRGVLISASAEVEAVTEYVSAVRAGLPDLRVALAYWPAADFRAFGLLASAGVTDIGIHVGSLDDVVRSRYGAPGLPLTGYERAWDEAVRVFGRYRVSTCLVVGAGENPGDLVTGAARLIARGVHPVVVPYRYGTDGPAEQLRPAGPVAPWPPIDPDGASAPLVRWLGHAVADMLRAVGASIPANPNLDQQPLQSSTRWGIR